MYEACEQLQVLKEQHLRKLSRETLILFGGFFKFFFRGDKTETTPNHVLVTFTSVLLTDLRLIHIPESHRLAKYLYEIQ